MRLRLYIACFWDTSPLSLEIVNIYAYQKRWRACRTIVIRYNHMWQTYK